MKKIDVVLAFRDKEYADAAARFLAGSEKAFSIAVRSSDYKVCDENEIVVRDFEEAVAYDEVGKLIAFDRFIEMDELSFRIKKRSHIPEHMMNVRQYEHDTQIIVVTGNRGGAGVSSVASAIADELTIYYGKKVMMIDFSPFPERTEKSAGCTVKELIYMLRKEKYNGLKENHALQSELDKYIVTEPDEILRLNYGNMVNYLAYAKSEEIVMLLRFLYEASGVDYIILDVGIHRLVHLFFGSNTVFAELTDTVISVGKGEAVYNHESGYEKFLGSAVSTNADMRLIRLLNCCDEDDCNFDENNEIIKADYDNASFVGKNVRIDGSFGIAIKNIAHKLVF